MTISTNIHLLQPVFTIQGYTGLKVKNILRRFLLFNGDTQSLRFRSFIFKMVAMLQILCIFPCVSCFKRATKAVQCPHPGPKISDKSQQILHYSHVCPQGQPPGMAADKCIRHQNPSIVPVLQETTCIFIENMGTPTCISHLTDTWYQNSDRWQI